ncbi:MULTISPECIES: G5 domain-containing protein [Corynebacterium]|uniref:G5 domain-containing protein n=1 Tax=Corynebacterium TaxID=1716 RepID=UPI000944D5FB
MESEIPFYVKVEFDPNMPAGTSETVTEGKPGKKTVTIKRGVTTSAWARSRWSRKSRPQRRHQALSP